MLASIPASRTSPWALGAAALLNTSFVALLLLLGLRSVVLRSPATAPHAPIAIAGFPLFAPPSSSGGQGGGQHNAVEALRGRPPQIERAPLAPPQVPVLDRPRLALDNAIAVPLNLRLPDDPSLSTIGMLHSANTTVVSGGRGSHGGIGNGDDGGYGDGHGLGFGPGSGDTVYTPGAGGVSAPVPVFTPEAEFSDEARRQKFQGVCMISIVVDSHGIPRDPRIVRPLGMGLDEKAIDAIRRYRFRPALRFGRPVAARLTVAVDFHLIF